MMLNIRQGVSSNPGVNSDAEYFPRVYLVRTPIVYVLCRPGLSFHHGKYVGCILTMEPVFMPVAELFGFLVVKRIGSPHGVGEVCLYFRTMSQDEKHVLRIRFD